MRCNEFGVHQGHSADVVDISKIAATKKEKESATVAEVKAVLPILQDCRNLISQRIRSVNDQAENVSAKISKKVEKVIEEIKLEEQDLLRRVDEARWQRLKRLESSDNELKEVMEKGSQAVALVTADSFSELTDAEYLQMSGTLIAPMSQAVRAEDKNHVRDNGPAVIFRPSNPRLNPALGDLLEVRKEWLSVVAQKEIVEVGSQFQADVLVSGDVKPHLSDQDVAVKCFRKEGHKLIHVPARVTQFDRPATAPGFFSFRLAREKILTIKCTPTTVGDYYIYPKLLGRRCSATRITVLSQEQLLYEPLATRFAADRYSKGHIRLHDEGRTAYCFQNHVGFAVGNAAHDKGVQAGWFKLGGVSSKQRWDMTLGVVSSGAVGFWPHLTLDRSILQGFSSVDSSWKDHDVVHLELDCDKRTLTATNKRSGDRTTMVVHGLPVSLAFHAMAIGQAVTIL